MTTRELIITTMQTLMYQNGYLNTSLSQIMATSNVGKGQLYHYFKSKKEIGLAATANLLDIWRKELFHDILDSKIDPETKLTKMLEWFFQFHDKQTKPYYGCPIGNLIIELSTQDEEFRQLLLTFINEWTNKLIVVIQSINPTLEKEQRLQIANHLISCLQGSILLLKVHQDTAYITQTINQLKLDLSANILFSN